MKKAILIFAAMAAIVQCGCQAMIYGTSSDLNHLQVGMTKEKVIKTMGDPISTGANADKHEEYLVYKRMRHTISEWPRMYQLTLRDGKLVQWGEKNEEKDVNGF